MSTTSCVPLVLSIPADIFEFDYKRKMRFKEGNSVEVFRKENDPCGCWFPGIVTSVEGNGYNIIVRQEGEAAVERVHEEDVRPQPPPQDDHQKGLERWTVGDIAEVFDIQCWRVAAIVKAIKNVHFVVRFVGSIHLKEFHKSSLRVRRAWHNNQWSQLVGIGKVQENKQAVDNIGTLAVWQGSCFIRGGDGKKNGKEMWLPEENHGHCSEPPSEELLMVDDISSIASCSLNEDGEAAEHPSTVNCSSRDPSSDAESSSFLPWSSKQKLVIKVEVHKQEVQAYKSTVQAMYSSGPLTWEQESLLTNLRLYLHISNDEHLLHLRHLLSTQPC